MAPKPKKSKTVLVIIVAVIVFVIVAGALLLMGMGGTSNGSSAGQIKNGKLSGLFRDGNHSIWSAVSW